MELLTVGHGTASQEELASLLQGAGIHLLVDVQTAPGSRRHPHVARAALAAWLPAAGVGYRWDARLGGFRRPAPDSPDLVWRNASFRGYAGHARTPDFRAAMEQLREEAAQQRTTVMCSESLWWRCHRRLIADVAVLTCGLDARHLGHDGRLTPHPVTPAPG